MRHRSPVLDRLVPLLSLLSVLSVVLAPAPSVGWSWTVALVAVAAVLAATAVPRLVPAPVLVVVSRVRRRSRDEPVRQDAPGRRGRPRPRAPGGRLRALTLLPAGHPTG